MGSVGDWRIAIVTKEAAGDILPPGKGRAPRLGQPVAGRGSVLLSGPIGGTRRALSGPARCLSTGALGNLEGEGGCRRPEALAQAGATPGAARLILRAKTAVPVTKYLSAA